MDLRGQLLSFLNELKRRNVLRVGAAYIVSSWLLIQVAETIFPAFGFGDAPPAWSSLSWPLVLYLR